jgi:hypothetical protein
MNVNTGLDKTSVVPSFSFQRVCKVYMGVLVLLLGTCFVREF